MGPFQLPPMDGHLPRMVAGRLFTLIRLFLFLVQNDQSQPGKRSKKSGAGTYHDGYLPCFRPFHLIVFLPLGQP